MKLYSGKYRHPFKDKWETFKAKQIKEIAVLIDRPVVSIRLALKGGNRLEFGRYKEKESVIVELKEVKVEEVK